jgi:hypothetical protein
MNSVEQLSQDVQVFLVADVPTREQIVKLEKAIVQELPLLSIDPVHHFADSLYAREITIPAGALLTGKVHKTKHFNVCFGDITVWTEQGMKRLTGFHRFESQPGTKRVGYAHAETVWITVHGSKETDLEALEAELIEAEDSLALAPSAEELKCLG